mmetsp:Transcript_87811/g.188385  ORF Transcript_87811/g.188385 Transcript_87811/m.188385 type:complete len:254 (+) Transcript_87811:617-1378(+)
MMRVEGAASTRKSHHSSDLGSGKSGACTGPMASPSRRFRRHNAALTVATSPTTTVDSSSTSTTAFSSMWLTCAQKASMSAICCGSIFARPFRCSVSLERNSDRVDTAFFPRWQCFRISSLKCGICNNWELFTSSACTRQRRNSIIACAVENHSRMQAISIITCVIFTECPSIMSKSPRNSGDKRWWRRCMCAHTRNWFFMMLGNVNERFLCSMTCPASLLISTLSVGRVGMLRLSEQAAKSSGPFFTRVDSVT